MNAIGFVITSGNWFFKVRDILSPLVFGSLVVTTRPLWRFGDPRDTSLVVLGIAISVLGQTLRAAVIGYAYVKRGGKDKKVYADTLVTLGFFNHMRNPMYVGNVLILLGLLTTWGSWVAVGVGGAFYLYLYWAITLAEEQYLRGRFGEEYDAYIARVNRYFPNFRGIGRTLEGMRYDWAKLVRKEYGTAFAWVGTLLLLLSRKAHLAGFGFDSRIQRTLLILLTLSASGWTVARVLKKRGMLGAG